jgi:hypothetical protein
MTVNTIPGLVISRVAPEQRIMASATLNLSRKMGSSMSMGVVMLFVSVLLGKAELDGVRGTDFLVCMRAILLVFMFLSAVPLTYAAIHYWRKFRGKGAPSKA